MHLSSCINGFHEYQAIWELIHGKLLDYFRENDNTNTWPLL